MMQTISVVLTTYNGERYLKEQLDSIRDQTRKPNEVIILDDGSSDGTVDLVRSYIAENSLSTWHLIQNDTNLGWRANFKKGFDLAQGDLIFPSDQDDVWHVDKIEEMVRVMMEHPDIMLLCSNYHLFVSGSDRRANDMQQTMVNDDAIEKIGITPRWYYIVRPGCTYCFRKEFYSAIVNRWDVQYAHDAILWRFACMRGGLYRLNKELIDFRRHGDNATSSFVWTRQNRIDPIDGYLWFHREALKVCSNDDQKTIRSIMTFLTIRKEVLQDRRIWKWFTLLFKYREFYNTNLGVYADLVYALK